MVRVSLAVIAATFLSGLLLDPHAADPYHTHFVLGGTAAAPAALVAQAPAQTSGPAHPPGVLWLRGADPSGPGLLHGGGLLLAGAPRLLLVPPSDLGRAWPGQHLAYPRVNLDPPPPPPRLT